MSGQKSVDAYLGKSKRAFECPVCSAMVWNLVKHATWHEDHDQTQPKETR